MSLKEQAIRSTLWSAVQKFGANGIRIVVLYVLARQLAVEEFGLMAPALTVVGLATVLTDGGMVSAIVQRHNLERGHVDAAFWISTVLGVGLWIVIILIAKPISLLYEPELVPILQWLGCSILLASLSIAPTGLLRRQMHFKVLAARQILAAIVGGGVAIGMTFAGMRFWSLVGLQITTKFVEVLIIYVATGYCPRFGISKRHFQDIFYFGSSVLGQNLLRYLGQRLPDLMLPVLLGNAAAGYFFLARRLVETLSQLTIGSLTNVVLPTFSKLQNDRERLIRALYKAIRFMSLAMLPTFVGLALVADDLVYMIYGEKWGPSIPLVWILCLIGVLRSQIVLDGAAIQAIGRPRIPLVITMIATGCDGAAIYIAYLWWMNVNAVAIGIVISALLVIPVRLLAMWKFVGIKLGAYIQQVVPANIGTLVMILCILALRMLLPSTLNLFVTVFVLVIAGVASYFLALWLIMPTVLQEIRELFSGSNSPSLRQ